MMNLKSLKERVLESIFNTLNDYICYDYTKGENEYIIIDLVELAKVEFKEDIDETIINKVFAELDSESSHRFWNFTSVELINSEIKMNLV